MKRFFLLEPVMALSAFSYFLNTPLMQQYVYRRLWLQMTNTSYPVSDTSSCTANSSSNNSNNSEEVQRQASLFSLYTDVLSTVPSLVVILMLVAYSDRAGRKITIIMPLIGMLINTVAYLTVSYFELNIYLLIGSSILSALCGGLGTFLGGCFAYIADLCKTCRQKTLRMAGVDMMVGLLAGGASVSTGGLSMIMLYELNEPLCWTEILIGYASALSSTVFLTSFVGVSVFTYCGVPQLLIVLLGILSLASGMVMAAFAKTTSMMFIAIASLLLSKMPFPVLRTMMSEIISKYEQGALFAFIYFLEVLTNTVSTGVFNSIYAGTVAWCPGFVFLLSAGLCVTPLSVIGVVVLMGVDFTKDAQVTTPFILEEENPDEGPSQNSP